MSKAGKQIALLMLIVVLAIAFFKLSDYRAPQVEVLQYSDFIKSVSESKIKTSVIIDGKKIAGYT
jgi:hypothetical protein